MSLNLQKGAKVDLTKSNPGLSTIGVGLGWDLNRGNGPAQDLDAFIVPLDSANKALPNDTCYYGNKTVLGGSLAHSGDNLTGVGDGDDETIIVKLTEVPANVEKLIIAVNIYEAATRNQNFGAVRNAFVRVYDKATNVELLKYDLGEDYSTFQGVVFGELYRHQGEWKFGAVSNGFNGTINDMLGMY